MKNVSEVAVAGGGVSVAVTRFPPEQKRPVGPLVVVGVRDGVLWLIDRYPVHYSMVLLQICSQIMISLNLMRFIDCCTVDTFSYCTKI